MKRALTILLSLSVTFSLTAQERHISKLHVYFGNAQVELEQAQRSTLRTACDSLGKCSIQSIHVDGYASPAGPFLFNEYLANTRADFVAGYLASLGVTCNITAEGHGEDWKGFHEGLNTSVVSSESKNVIEREVMSLNTNHVNEKGLSERNVRLQAVEGKKVYNRLANELFPTLRRADITIEYYKKIKTAVPVSPAPESKPLLLQPVSQSILACASGAGNTAYERRIIFALRSNALLPLTNIGIIVPIGKHFSIGGDWYSPWFWHDRKNSWCLEFQAADVEFRYWFNPRQLAGYHGHSLTGHSIGIGVFAGHYDFEKRYDGFQGEVYGGYVDYTYALWLAKYLRLEFSLGVGYARLPWRQYHVYTVGGKLLRPRPVKDNFINWFGPVKAGISLVVPIEIKYKAKEGRKDAQ